MTPMPIPFARFALNQRILSSILLFLAALPGRGSRVSPIFDCCFGDVSQPNFTRRAAAAATLLSALSIVSEAMVGFADLSLRR